MNSRWLTIKQLDRQLAEWKAASKYERPKDGWVKTIRTALSMSIEQLASRMGLKGARISQLENAEVDDAVTLRTLKAAANAMECELVYAIVPKGSSTLESIIKTRAQQLAKERTQRVAHTMSLEDQSVDSNVLREQQEALIKSLTEHLNKKFWASSEDQKSQEQKLITAIFGSANPKSKPNTEKQNLSKLEKLIDNLKKKK